MKYDVLIIGAGIIGCALAYELAKYDLEVIVLEKSSYIASGATKANSAMLHEGLSIKPGTLRARFVKNSKKNLCEVMEKLHVPFHPGIGLITVAFDEHEMGILAKQEEDAHKAGLHAQLLNREEALAMEPNLNPAIVGAFYSTSVSVLGPYELCIALAENAARNHVHFRFHSEVIGIERNRSSVTTVITKDVRYKASVVINAAGIYSDKIAAMVEDIHFSIRPRKGEYFLYDKAYGDKVSHVISVLGNDQSKGMIIVPTVHGNLLAGSSAVMIEDKEDHSTTKDTMDMIYQNAISRMVPSLKRNVGVITSFAGLRAASTTEDYVIEHAKTADNFINVAGIQSPGLSSCIAIARYVIDLCKETKCILEWKERNDYVAENPKYTRITEMTLEEATAKIKENPSYGEIVCRCELITKGEILDAVHGVVPAVTIDAIKRKLRCGMGRCQGGFCLQRILNILHEECDIAMEEILKDTIGTNYIMNATKKGGTRYE